MEIEELKTIWQQYDLKLNNLEKLNKKLVMETLSKKPQRNLNWMKYKSIYGVLMGPIVLIIVFYPYFKIENIDLKFVIGGVLTIAVVVYLAYFNFKSFWTLSGINIGEDPIIESARKVNDYKSIIISRHRYVWISYPILFAGVLLIGWKSFNFDTKTILLMAGLFVFSLALGFKQFKNQRQKVEKLEKEIFDLEEYAK